MANRTLSQDTAALIKRVVQLFCSFSVSGTTPTLLKYNYPVFSTGPNARTYTAAATAAAPLGFPQMYQAGSEGAFSIARTATGLYTLTLQDQYQRLVGLSAYPASAGGTPTFASVSENTTISAMGTTSSTPSVIGLAFWDYAGAAVDPVGSVRLCLTLADGTEP